MYNEDVGNIMTVLSGWNKGRTEDHLHHGEQVGHIAQQLGKAHVEPLEIEFLEVSMGQRHLLQWSSNRTANVGSLLPSCIMAVAWVMGASDRLPWLLY